MQKQQLPRAPPQQKRAQLEQTEQSVKTEEVHPAPPATVDATVLLDGRAAIVRTTSTNATMLIAATAVATT